MAMEWDMASARVLVCGFWASELGECHISSDKVTSKLAYEELIGDGSERLHGWLEEVSDEASEENGACIPVYRWQASLMQLSRGESPWYGPSCGEQPEVIGDVQVIFRPGGDGSLPLLQTRIKAQPEESWTEPVAFERVIDDGN
eukprot:TRINITY_DN25295_c0_g1_i1.p1 TRINITY_DN25295_c0_g1~~TRINITY_DN25295_c0_g1_i1.p1  ORF type:complete len:144 (-),score=23.82 TRINITY_DN25295_c0_g1_i1:442-873(-)